MKTKKAMKKITHIGMAALVAMGMLGTSCNKVESQEMETPETPETPETQKENIVTLTTTVGFAADGTKALTSTGVKTFAVGETMAIYYWKNKGNDHEKAVSAPLTAGDITNGGKSATFTFTLDNPYKDMSVVYTYPAAMANADFTPNYDALYNNQDGTLATLASDFDFCTGSRSWSGENLPSLTLENQLAILAITLKNADGSSDITSSITGLTLSDGTKTYNVNRSAVAGPIYVAIFPTADATITVTATDGTKNYTKTLTGKTYAKGNGYPVSWKMAEAAATARPLAEATTDDLGKIAGADGYIYDTKAAAKVAGTQAVAMIAYVGSKTDNFAHKYGFAIALSDEGEIMDWSTAKSTCEGKASVSDAEWMLPSQEQWKAMFNAFGGNEGSYTGLNTALAIAGGDSSKLQEGGGRYWSSQPDGNDNAWRVVLEDGGAYWYNLYVNYKLHVRACLVFGDYTARPLAEATTDDLGKIAGADGYIYDTKAAAEAASTQAVAMIAYVGSETDHSTYKHGLAIALSDEGGMTWSTAKSTCEGKTAVSGAAWMLPSQEQWKTMFKANGGDEAKYDGLNTALATAGDELKKDGSYWSSTPYDGGRAWYARLIDAQWRFDSMDYSLRVRACLAF